MGRATGTASLPISREPFSLSLFVSFSEALSPVGRVAILQPVVIFRDNDVAVALHGPSRSPDFPPLSQVKSNAAPDETWKRSFNSLMVLTVLMDSGGKTTFS